MGPRFCKRGNRPQQRPLFANFDSLQWGHAFVSVETQRVRRVIAQHKEASMGPRFCKRGNARQLRPDRHRCIASMGPRFCKRGNVLNRPVELWPLLTLQWGHAFVSVETYCVQAGQRSSGGASMGPRFCKRGNIALTVSRF